MAGPAEDRGLTSPAGTRACWSSSECTPFPGHAPGSARCSQLVTAWDSSRLGRGGLCAQPCAQRGHAGDCCQMPRWCCALPPRPHMSHLVCTPSDRQRAAWLLASTSEGVRDRPVLTGMISASSASSAGCCSSPTRLLQAQVWPSALGVHAACGATSCGTHAPRMSCPAASTGSAAIQMMQCSRTCRPTQASWRPTRPARPCRTRPTLRAARCAQARRRPSRTAQHQRCPGSRLLQAQCVRPLQTQIRRQCVRPADREHPPGFVLCWVGLCLLFRLVQNPTRRDADSLSAAAAAGPPAKLRVCWPTSCRPASLELFDGAALAPELALQHTSVKVSTTACR